MKIVIPGDPISQTRMKHSARGGFSRVYDPRAKQKNELKHYLKSKFEGVTFKHPRISFVFHMPIPKSIPKKLLNLYRSGMFKHEKKPDADNLVKLYLDCMDNIFFEGDQCVMLGPPVKLYHSEPKTLIYINETTQTLTPPEIDPHVWMDLFGSEFGKCSLVETGCLFDLCNQVPPVLPQFYDMKCQRSTFQPST